MPRQWNRYNLDDLTHIWMGYKLPSCADPLNQRTVQHRRIEITPQEMEELVDHLIQKLWGLKDRIDGI